MTLRLPDARTRWWPLLAAGCLLTSCGVPEQEHEALQKENQELQRTIDQANAQILQLQGQLQVAQQGAAAVAGLQAKVQELEQRILEKDVSLLELQKRFDAFKAQRRSAMIGKEYPMLQLDDGRRLTKARIMSLADGELSIRHDDGSLKIALANTNDDLRWEACFDPSEEKDAARRRMLANVRRLDAQTERNRIHAEEAMQARQQQQKAAADLRAAIASQRTALNQAYQKIIARNPSALQGAHWDASYPENSGLINVFSERRAVLGISELDSQAAAIKANLLKLKDLESGGSAP